MNRSYVVIALLAAMICGSPAMAQRAALVPETLTVRNGQLTLGALYYKPAGPGQFPAVLFNHGSGPASDTARARLIGETFARNGYAIMLLHRRGALLSRSAGTSGFVLMDRAFRSGGDSARLAVQLELLEVELTDAVAGLSALRSRPDIDKNRLAVVGHSFGGQLALLLASRDSTIDAAVAFAPAAATWDRSPALRAKLLDAVRVTRRATALVFARNDRSIEPGTVLAMELERRGTPHRLLLYPPAGTTAAEGHAFLYTHVREWERDVFAFLAAHVH